MMFVDVPSTVLNFTITYIPIISDDLFVSTIVLE